MKSLRYIALSVLLAAGLVSCNEKPVEYVPAEAVGNAEVYFPTGQTASYNLKEVSSIEVTVSRVNKEGNLNVPVALTASNPAFTAPSSVSFASGQASTTLQVSVDLSQITESVTETVTLKLGDQTTPYGEDSFTFTAELPAAWITLGKGHIVMDWWGEERDVVMTYRDLDEYPGMRLCKLAGAWGPDAGNNDYIFYWNTNTNELFIPMQYTGYSTSDGTQIWYSDAAGFYNLYQANNFGYTFPSAEYFKWSNAFCVRNDFSVPQYDGNGGFYLADWFYIVADGAPTGRGYQFGGTQDEFILDGFVRTIDYNDDKHFGSATALWDGTVSSMVFSTDGVEPIEFESTLYYDAEYELDEKTTEMEITYYLQDYFAEGYNLAFTSQAPELLEDGTAITDVENEQFSGINIFGYPVYAKVKKGSVSYPADADFPAFKIELSLYTLDEEGNKVHDFGTIADVFTAEAEAKTGYTIDDIYGGYFEDYLGVWECYSTDLGDGQEYGYNILLADAKQTNADGNPMIKIVNLSGLSSYFDDTVYAEFTNYSLLVHGQELQGTYQGTPLTLGLVDVLTGKAYASAANAVLGGICSDGALAFVNRYNGVDLSGFAWIAGSQMLTGIANIYAFGPATSSMAKKPLSKKFNANQLYTDGLKAEAAANVGNMAIRRPGAKSVKTSTKRTLHLSPVANVKNFEVISL